jgi:hypothetical protein
VRASAAVLAGLALLASSTDSSAQILMGREAPRSGSWEAGGGITWSTSVDGPEATAELTDNGQTSGGFDLFTSEGRLENGAGLKATLAYYLSSAVAIEGGLRYSKPRLSYRLSGDFEDAPDLTAEETLSRYVITGSVVWHLRSGQGKRLIPFVVAGAGYIRDLHEENELVETGTEYHGGGGVKYWLGSGRRRWGLRGEAAMSIRDGGFDFRDGTRTAPVLAGTLIYLF